MAHKSGEFVFHCVPWPTLRSPALANTACSLSHTHTHTYSEENQQLPFTYTQYCTHQRLGQHPSPFLPPSWERLSFRFVSSAGGTCIVFNTCLGVSWEHYIGESNENPATKLVFISPHLCWYHSVSLMVNAYHIYMFTASGSHISICENTPTHSDPDSPGRHQWHCLVVQKGLLIAPKLYAMRQATSLILD